ncbi:MAG: hypothetical protein II132_01000 [Desulfovibrio sp.]|nr:hypothetical protein [Desulfovibrio sp.]
MRCPSAPARRTAVCSFGDLLRVPGTRQSLSQARAAGADVRMVYSPLDCLRLAAQDLAKEFVFLSVGLETTVPSECQALKAPSANGKLSDATNRSLHVAPRCPCGRKRLEQLLQFQARRHEAGLRGTRMGCARYASSAFS